MAGTVSELKGVLAHIDQAIVNTKAPTEVAKQEVKKVGQIAGSRLGNSQVGNDVVGHLADAILHFDHARAQIAMAAMRAKKAIQHVESL